MIWAAVTAAVVFFTLGMFACWLADIVRLRR